VNLTVAPARALVPALRKRFATFPLSRLSAAAAHPHRSAVASESHWPGRSLAMRDRFLRRPQRPGYPQTLSRFGNLSSMSFKSALADPRATAAEPALRDHWQRDIHACSESTLSHPEPLRNQKAHARCANPVDDVDCLWKSAEKMGIICGSRVIMVCIRTKPYPGLNVEERPFMAA
jgi:hypothetical protein